MCANHDEYSTIGIAMEDVKVVNGLECKMACSSSKVSTVPAVFFLLGVLFQNSYA